LHCDCAARHSFALADADNIDEEEVKIMKISRVVAVLASLAICAVIGCSQKPATPDSSQAAGGSVPPASAPGAAGGGSTASSGAASKSGGGAASEPAAQKVVREITIPAGTAITVRLGETLSSKRSQAGQSFSATVAGPVTVEGKTVIQRGAAARGTVVDAKDIGHFKGQARLEIRLDSVSINGQEHPIHTSDVARVVKGKGKRSAGFIGGGAAAGALIGALAGGGKGAAIGALAGGGAGTAGAAFTGNKDIVLPAETALSFRLKEAITVRE
jgi:hypothetical protein